MPIYEYRCKQRHRIESLRKFEDQTPEVCTECGETMARIISAHHQAPDGIYSYEPNLGSADAFDRKMAAQGK
jgi:putative FmdB family regulatory protein